MFYLFYGNDPFTLGETVARLRERMMKDDPMAELNQSDLDGRSLQLGALKEAAEAMPFMGERRLVVVRDLVGRCNPRGGDKSGRSELADGLTDLLSSLPPTTRLVLHETTVHGNNPVLRWAKRWQASQPVPEAACVIKAFEAPKPPQLPAWISRRAKQREGSIEANAATALADALVRDRSVDLGLADNELEKLLTYAGQRSITAADVELLVTPVSLESIFRFIDVLAERNGPEATTMLHRFLENNEPPLRILALVARQFRLLSLAKALSEAGIPQGELAGRLSVPPFAVRKLVSQSSRFSSAFLDAALRRLVEIDHSVKTGRIDAVLALDLFVSGVCGTRAA